MLQYRNIHADIGAQLGLTRYIQIYKPHYRYITSDIKAQLGLTSHNNSNPNNRDDMAIYLMHCITDSIGANMRMDYLSTTFKYVDYTP